MITGLSEAIWLRRSSFSMSSTSTPSAAKSPSSRATNHGNEKTPITSLTSFLVIAYAPSFLMLRGRPIIGAHLSSPGPAMACSPWRSQLTACRIRSCASICSSGRNLAEFLMPETGIQRISVHLAECHEGDNDESSSEPRASLSELPPHLTMLVEGCGRGFNQAATSHLHG